MDSYTRNMIEHMSARTGTTLTRKHEAVLAFAYEYHSERGIGPLYRSIEKATGVSKPELDGLFPHGLGSVYAWVGIPLHEGQQACKPTVSVQVRERREIYLDHAATAPPRPEVLGSMESLRSSSALGNAGSSHVPGKRAYQVVSRARSAVAECLQVPVGRVVFTSGGSEANNLAVKGVALEHLARTGRAGHIVSTRVEHASVLQSLEFLRRFGFQVSLVDVGRDGVVHPGAVERAMTPETILVAVMAVNNETGVVNPIGEIGAVCERAQVPLMVDAVQCFGKRPLAPRELRVSMLSLSGHKIGGPSGVGALYVKEGVRLAPLIHGGEQEHGLRAGTESVAQVHGLGIAARIAHERMECEARHILDLQQQFLEGLRRAESDFVVNGEGAERLPNVLNVGFKGVDSGSLLLSLSAIGVSIAAGSACAAGSKESSHVLRAMSADTERYGNVRFSFGHSTSAEDLQYVLEYLPPILGQLRKLRRKLRVPRGASRREG